ncbi:MAG: hypothetical protein JWN24_3681 [Phycisphaerales bacterium]|nr:hypothetical protein [Phycisphaerales bacterium]
MEGNKLSVVSCQLPVIAGDSRSSLAKMRRGLPLATGNWQLATSARRGFSFTEILFAVMILGIGFIMIAAMFPVAIKQTQATQEETIAAAIARSGADYLGRNANDLWKLSQPPFNQSQYGWPNFNTMPVVTVPPPAANPPVSPAAVVVGEGNLWTSAVGNMILPSDRRFAWVPFYRRDAGSSFAQVIVIGTQVRNRSSYDVNDYVQYGGSPGRANLQGKPIQVMLVDGIPMQQPDTIVFSPMPGSPDYTGFVAEGCYVIIADDPGAVSPGPAGTNVLHTANGYVYRVGLPRPNLSPFTWELMSGNDMKGASVKPVGRPRPLVAYIVGRGYTNPDPNNPDLTPSGPAMDVAVYTTFVRVNTPQ